jgi:hypothetical protein
MIIKVIWLFLQEHGTQRISRLVSFSLENILSNLVKHLDWEIISRVSDISYVTRGLVCVIATTSTIFYLA